MRAGRALRLTHARHLHNVAMTVTRYYTATTLDGFIADANHSLAWLFTRRQDPDGPLAYKTFIAGVGALAMGSTTYEWILRHEQSTWPYELPCWVFTHRDLPVVAERIELTSDDVADVHTRMRAAAEERDIWIVGGGDLAGQFAERGLLDEVIVYIAPVTLGAGAPLLPRHVELRLEELERNGDFACARYAVLR
jgi:dihydrofolate reductase